MLERLSLDDFTPLVSQPFRVTVPGGVLDLTLVEASRAGTALPGRRAPFSLVFRGAATPVLPQAIYTFDHPSIGTIEMFIVPIGPEAGGMTYEAVFS